MIDPKDAIGVIQSTRRRVPKVVKSSFNDHVFVYDPSSDSCYGCGQVTNVDEIYSWKVY